MCENIVFIVSTGWGFFKFFSPPVPLRSPRHRWEDNLTMDFKEISINTRNGTDSAQGRNFWRTLVNAALILRVPLVMELLITVIN